MTERYKNTTFKVINKINKVLGIWKVVDVDVDSGVYCKPKKGVLAAELIIYRDYVIVKYETKFYGSMLKRINKAMKLVNKYKHDLRFIYDFEKSFGYRK